MAEVATLGRWEDVLGKCVCRLASFFPSPECLWLDAVRGWVLGQMNLGLTWQSCYGTSLFVLSQRESPPECDSEQECDAALPSLPRPAWTAGQCRDIGVYLSTCIRRLKFLGLNVPFSDYDLQKAIASSVSKPHCF